MRLTSAATSRAAKRSGHKITITIIIEYLFVHYFSEYTIIFMFVPIKCGISDEIN